MVSGISSQTIGASLAIGASIISNVGVNIQKKAHNENNRRRPAHQLPYILLPLWWLGISLIVLGSIGDFAALGFAPQALVAALGGGATLVANVFAAYYMNSEQLFRTDILGLSLVVLGVIMVAVITEPDHPVPLSELEKRFVRPGFIAYTILLVLLIVSLLAAIKGTAPNKLKTFIVETTFSQKRDLERVEKRLRIAESRIKRLEFEAGLTSGDAMDLSMDVLPLKSGLVDFHSVDGQRDAANSRRKEARAPYLYASAAGVVGASSVLLAKISALLVGRSLEGDNQFTHPLTYVFLSGMVATILLQTHLLNEGMSRGDTMTVFPIFQVFWIGFSVLGGIVFYEEAKSFDTIKWIVYPLALLIVVAGVAFLVQHEKKKAREHRKSIVLAGETKTVRAPGALSPSVSRTDGEMSSIASPLLESS